ncbi:DNA binding,ATP binding isoform 1 [Dorcoceras hygrometricum]|uniref:DNA binding,ATP binding isoform 1 n=1 Tax=Dorcoceras hygrometricum TaxID=472368 RepID=A0A2Z7APJ3_9LAMI|nr:DNA binding,ATP binding isoform 1 [Dorcoceras hygrometricum]
MDLASNSKVSAAPPLPKPPPPATTIAAVVAAPRRNLFRPTFRGFSLRADLVRPSVQADKGTLLPVVDLIRRYLPPPTVKSQSPFDSGWSQAPVASKIEIKKNFWIGHRPPPCAAAPPHHAHMRAGRAWRPLLRAIVALLVLLICVLAAQRRARGWRGRALQVSGQERNIAPLVGATSAMRRTCCGRCAAKRRTQHL